MDPVPQRGSTHLRSTARTRSPLWLTGLNWKGTGWSGQGGRAPCTAPHGTSLPRPPARLYTPSCLFLSPPAFPDTPNFPKPRHSGGSRSNSFPSPVFPPTSQLHSPPYKVSGCPLLPYLHTTADSRSSTHWLCSPIPCIFQVLGRSLFQEAIAMFALAGKLQFRWRHASYSTLPPPGLSNSPWVLEELGLMPFQLQFWGHSYGAIR